ncbi:MAG: MbnP family protein, partial [Sediminibacterium sp.]
MKRIFCLLYLITCFFAEARAQKVRPLTIQFVNRFGTDPLIPEQTYYLGKDTLVVNRFKYYVSHIKLTNSKGKIFTPANEYFLIDIADEKTTRLTLSVPEDDYVGIGFLLGVDSIR